MPLDDDLSPTEAVIVIRAPGEADSEEVAEEFHIRTLRSGERERDLKEMSPMPGQTDVSDDSDDSEETEADAKPKKPSGVDWDALIAAAEEDYNLLESPIDAAVKTLMSGKEVQKLGVIRSMADTITVHGEEAVNRLLPLVQDLLTAEGSLDLHCDASDLYKTLIRGKQYETSHPGLRDKLLGFILENVERVKENVSAASWLETLLAIADSLSPVAVTDMIVPLAVSQANPAKRIQRRVIAARLLEKLCAIIPVENIRKDVAPCARMLCQDPNATVRTAIAQRLSVIAQSLNNSADCVSLLLPCLIELCKDDDPGVREAILNTIAVCLPYFTKESRKTVVIPLLRKCTEQALILRDISLAVVAKQLGPWLYALKELLSPQEQRWFLDTYVRIVNLPVNSDSDKTLQTLSLNCRRHCAYNFPCFAMIYGGEVFSERLLPVMEKMSGDSDEEIRCTIAAGFHEIVQMRPDELALLHVFFELVRSGAVEVVQQVVKGLHKSLPFLYAAVQREQEKRNAKVTRVHLDRVVVGCNRLVRNTGNWRAHEAYLMNLVALKGLVAPNDLVLTFVPVLKQEVLGARALPCRIAAAVALLHLMREFPLAKHRLDVVHFFTETIGSHSSCQRRRVLLDVVPMLLQHFSRDFFKEHFLAAVLRLADDPVSNIRLQLCRMMPRIKKSLLFPEDEPAIFSLEKSVRALLTAEGACTHDRQLLQQYACELSRAETVASAKADAAKVAEERRLWTEVEAASTSTDASSTTPLVEVTTITEPSPPPRPHNTPARKGVVVRRKSGGLVEAGAGVGAAPNLLRPPTTTTNGPTLNALTDAVDRPLTWKTQRLDKSRVAVVKPQPQVIITQRSPSPMPPRDVDLKASKLPLSTRYRNSSVPASNGVGSPTTSSPPASSASRIRSLRSESVSAPSSRPSLSRPPLSFSPSASSLMSKSLTGSFNSPTSTSTSAYSSGLATSRSLSQMRRPYGLMKVQSSSAIERKPAHLSIRVTGMS